MADPKARFVLSATDATGPVFTSVDRRFAAISRSARSFQSNISLARSAFAGFGIVAGARIFTHFISDSLKVADLTREQREGVDAAAASWAALGKAIKQAVAERAAASASYSGAVADGIRRDFFPGSFTKSLADLNADLDQLRNRTLPNQMAERLGVDFLERLVGMDEAEWSRRIGQTLKDIAALEQQIASFGLADRQNAAISEAMKGMRTLNESGLDSQLALLGHNVPLRTPNIKVDWLLPPDELQDVLVTAREMTVDELLKPFPSAEVRTLFEPLKDDGLEAAQFVGDSFRDAFTGWLLDGELKFKDFLRRMAIQLGTSALFNFLGSSFPGVPLLGKLFGGSRASGGSTRAGMVYRVHPGEAFFTPGSDGHVGKAGGRGVTQHITVNIQTGLPSQVRAELEQIGYEAGSVAGARMVGAAISRSSRPAIA